MPWFIFSGSRKESHMCDLVEHARRELERAQMDPKVKEDYLKILRLVSRINRSGIPPVFNITTLFRLLHRQNLTPLTDAPEEWMLVRPDIWEIEQWQNCRNDDAWSYDGGKTYWLMSESFRRNGKRKLHKKKYKTVRAKLCQPIPTPDPEIPPIPQSPPLPT
jgi:hypothetical protein